VNRTFLIMVVVAVLAASAGYFAAKSIDTGKATAPESFGVPDVDDLLGRERPAFTHESIDGTAVSASDFDGRVWLVNFWATWCKPCVDEMPMLSDLRSKEDGKGLEVVGIALDDADRARKFAEELSIAYPILVGQADVVLTGRRYGNSTGLLPFSVLIDADGMVRWIHLGALEREVLLDQVRALD
jgi:peroxiredoxin